NSVTLAAKLRANSQLLSKKSRSSNKHKRRRINPKQKKPPSHRSTRSGNVTTSLTTAGPNNVILSSVTNTADPITTSSVSNLYFAYGSANGGVAGPHAVICGGTNADDPCNNPQQRFTYDGNGNLMTYSPSPGNTYRFGYDLNNHLRSTIDPASNVTT